MHTTSDIAKTYDNLKWRPRSSSFLVVLIAMIVLNMLCVQIHQMWKIKDTISEKNIEPFPKTPLNRTPLNRIFYPVPTKFLLERFYCFSPTMSHHTPYEPIKLLLSSCPEAKYLHLINWSQTSSLVATFCSLMCNSIQDECERFLSASLFNIT